MTTPVDRLAEALKDRYTIERELSAACDRGLRTIARALSGIVVTLVGACGGDQGTNPPADTDTTTAMAAVSGGGQTGTVAQPLGQPLVVKVTSSSGGPVSGVGVTWAVTAGGGSVSSASSTTDSAGLASATWTLGTAAGTGKHTAAASVNGLSGPPVTFTAVATAGPAAKLTFLVQPGPAAGAEPIAPAVQVAVQDAFENTVAMDTGGVTLRLGTNPSAGTLLGTLTAVPSQGIAVFSNLRVDLPGSGYTLVASAPGLAEATSASFDVTLTFAALSGGGFPSSLVSPAGGHTCGVTTGGAPYCWGNNQDSKLGDGTTTSRNSPVAVLGQLTLSTVEAGEVHNCGLAPGGAAYCWGANYAGQLGDGTTSPRSSPVTVVGGLTFTALAVGAAHACGVTSNGTAYCWGLNYWGQLGDGTTTNRAAPVPVTGALSFVALSAGTGHTCGVTTGGPIYCWGWNLNGQLGDSTNSDRASPVLVAGELAFTAVSAGEQTTCGIVTGGAAYCWGGPWSPVAVPGSLTYAALSAGGSHTCGLTPEGAAYCWGSNNAGQLGDGTTTQRSDPVPVSGGMTLAKVIAGPRHTCALTSTGLAYCWGSDDSGQLGTGTTTGLESCTIGYTTVRCSTTPAAVKTR